MDEVIAPFLIIFTPLFPLVLLFPTYSVSSLSPPSLQLFLETFHCWIVGKEQAEERGVCMNGQHGYSSQVFLEQSNQHPHINAKFKHQIEVREAFNKLM